MPVGIACFLQLGGRLSRWRIGKEIQQSSCRGFNRRSRRRHPFRLLGSLRNLLPSPSYNQKPATQLALIIGCTLSSGMGNALANLPLTAGFPFLDTRARSVG